VIDHALPPLALALAAVASSRLGIEASESALRTDFIPAVAAMDEADRVYRRTIEDTLAPQTAGAVLSGMASFREQVREIREHSRREIAELYRVYNRTYGWFDPLDSFRPPIEGLSHADGTRVATIADRSRAHVDSLRAQVNEAALKRLDAVEIEALVAAKRRRLAAFEAALKTPLESAAATHPFVTPEDVDKALYQLTQLADGWY
jgi:hypothetical protein